jgi:hypothetical protein
MHKIVLLVVGAAWLAVLVPPLLRSRLDSRPNSSVVHFQRRLTSLQRGGARLPQMQPFGPMARPLARPSAAPHDPRPVAGTMRTATLERRPVHRAGQPAVRSQAAATRSLVKRRRQNVLFALASLSVATAFVAFAARSTSMVYLCALSVCALAGYCYKLAQLRRAEEERWTRVSWQRAA